MLEHIKNILVQQEIPAAVKEEIAYRVIFKGEDPQQLMVEYEIGNPYVINNWVSGYKKKIETGLVTLPPMTAKQQQDLDAQKSRIKELEKALQDANLKILALNTMIDIAEKELKIPIRKKSGTKRS